MLYHSQPIDDGRQISEMWERQTVGGYGLVPRRREIERAFGQNLIGVRVYQRRPEPRVEIHAMPSLARLTMRLTQKFSQGGNSS